MENTTAAAYYVTGKREDFFRKRHTATIAFIVGLLLFLMPFAELKCGNFALAGNTGIGIAAGSQWKIAMGGSDVMNKLNEKAKQDKKGDLETGPNIFAIVSIVAGLLGLLVYLSGFRARPLVGVCAGVLAALMLIALMIHFKIMLKSSIPDNDSNLNLKSEVGQLIKVQFTIWYYLSLAAFGTAAFFSYKHYQQELDDKLREVQHFEFQNPSREIMPPV